MNHRLYPRINVSLPIKIDPDILGKAVDISETGLGLVFQKPLLLTNAKTNIEISPKEKIDTEFKIIWSKHLVEKKGFRYGVCFIRLKENDLSILRDVLIQNHIQPMVEKIEDSALKEKVLEFWQRDAKKYITQFDFLSRRLNSKDISLDEASEKVKTMTDTLLEKADSLESMLNNKVLVAKMKETFRLICGPWAYRGNIVKRAFEKPRGYPGDYLTVEAIYDNKSLSGNIGYCCDMYFLSNSYAMAVRNRKDRMRELLTEYIPNIQSSSVDILNIACGSSREIAEVLSSKGISRQKICFTLTDQDEEALEFSKKVLKLSGSDSVKFRYFQHNILDYVKKEKKYTDIMGRQDLIYSIGLADYLPDRVLKKFISFCFNLLKPGGSLILAHKDIARYKPIATDWWCDWSFYSRSEKDLLNIIKSAQIENFSIKLEREKSNIIMFVTITKS